MHRSSGAMWQHAACSLATQRRKDGVWVSSHSPDGTSSKPAELSGAGVLHSLLPTVLLRRLEVRCPAEALAAGTINFDLTNRRRLPAREQWLLAIQLAWRMKIMLN